MNFGEWLKQANKKRHKLEVERFEKNYNVKSLDVETTYRAKNNIFLQYYWFGLVLLIVLVIVTTAVSYNAGVHNTLIGTDLMQRLTCLQ
jgi:hypothetical protein